MVLLFSSYDMAKKENKYCMELFNFTDPSIFIQSLYFYLFIKLLLLILANTTHVMKYNVNLISM